MIQAPDIRRRHDGSIDFDFYRAQATALRGEAMRDAFKAKVLLKFTLLMTAMVIAVAIAASTLADRTYCLHCTAKSAIAAPSQVSSHGAMRGTSNLIAATQRSLAIADDP